MADYSIRNRTVIAATANRDRVTLYFQEGDTMDLPSNQEFTKKVVDTITPALARGETITLDMENKTLDIFSNYEKKSNGFVKFFRVMRKTLTGKEITPELLESIALPLNSVDLEDEDETVVAVVTNSGETVYVDQEELEAAADIYDRMANPAPKPGIILGAEKLAAQVKHFTDADTNDEGFKNFLSRMAKVTETRQHTAEELMDFLKKNDLPIASDGCIVAYKRLATKDADRGIFVDSYSRKVTQRIGTTVFMKAEMVDPNRRNQCSNGLHVGRRDYMRSFGGDSIVLVKIKPEDVIAVPQDYSGAKMRCCAYTIVGVVEGKALERLSKSEDMTSDPSAAQLLTRVLSGDHPEASTTVEITLSHGEGLVFRDSRWPDWEPESMVQIVDRERESMIAEPVSSAEPVAETKALEEVTTPVALIDPKEISPEVIKEKSKQAGAAPIMTEQQKKAKYLWPEIAAGNMSKSQVARECGTSPRSLDRWAIKFNF